jgi:hypothetical protein
LIERLAPADDGSPGGRRGEFERRGAEAEVLDRHRREAMERHRREHGKRRPETAMSRILQDLSRFARDSTRPLRIWVKERIGVDPNRASPGVCAEPSPAPAPVPAPALEPRPTRVHVGCGPDNLLAGWCNVDIRSFPGVDAVLDVSKPWPFSDLDYVYGEHFLEHLTLPQAIDFLYEAGRALKPRGRLRLSTPNLRWVLLTHFDHQSQDPVKAVLDTLRTNRAFHGWGHHFLHTRASVELLLSGMGFREIEWCNYGESRDPNLRGLEKHGDFSTASGEPSVIIVEASLSSIRRLDPERAALIDLEYIQHVAGGH